MESFQRRSESEVLPNSNEEVQGRINTFLIGEEMSSDCLEPKVRSPSSVTEMSYGSLIRGHYHHTPFLQLLQSAMQAEEETEEQEEQQLHLQVVQQQHQQALFTSFPPESNFQLLLRLQSHGDKKRMAEIDSSRAAEQLESCVTHASESQSDAKGVDGHEPSHHLQLPSGTTRSTAAAAPAGSRERKKRKRLRTASAASTKSTEEAESQRMAHIAVERNRRRLMNDHLAALRALIPPSFVPRGDQASIIGGAIDFVKELEQLLVLLLAKKRQRTSAASTSSAASSSCTTLSRSTSEEEGCPAAAPATAASLEGFFISPQYTSYSQSQQPCRRAKEEEDGEESPAAKEGVDVEAIVLQGHVNLKVVGRRQAGQLVQAIAALEELRLSVLHLNITSLDPSSILYSLNLKMEEECKLGSADEIATAVHQIFGYINASR
ncbi:transcription factor bHLH57-like isoform X2 [Phoenix dactylifera]|uniref:Transcription factor bHLH57-like isoform X2 n=1 Tax=Phoenix dactylifera TaxID=42345 RepID=A0A8B9AF69_PHODC|nr:transcription factor bHLH57-like isoform X2 [Phoenix dactylifera]